ncbi:uncharacterized protein LOC141855541 [Brevipalpus obovatus]|uniref:uncharacterized protein LOC141855541 n=1 Tax=Brevipalpus obovatus TaxID=246614 RepID=UPI003D9EE5BE
MMMKIFWTLLAFSLLTANFVQCEDDEERERDEEKEDNGRVDPSCLRTYGNRNCSQIQQDAAIRKYQTLRQKQLQSILANVSSSAPMKSSPKPSPNLVLMAVVAEPTATNLTSSPAPSTVSSPTSLLFSSSLNKALDDVSSNESSSLNSSSAASNIDTSSTSPTSETKNVVPQSNNTVDSVQNSVVIEPSSSSSPIFGPPTGFSSCDRAYRLIQVADLFARYNAACEARVFGIAGNPDFWIRRCAKAVRAKNK